MTDYVKIKDELERLGWRGEQANGDHIKFRLEGNPRYIVLSMQVNSSARAFSNMVAQIRRIEPRFSLGRPAGWVPPKTITDVAEQECEATEESVAAAAQIGEYDKSYRKSKSWIKVGAEVTLDGKEGAYTVSEIISYDNKSIFCEEDIIGLTSKEDEQSFEVASPDIIHMATGMNCIRCGQYRPMDFFNHRFKSEEKRCTCIDCLNLPEVPVEREMLMSDKTMNPAKNEPQVELESEQYEILRNNSAYMIEGLRLDILNKALSSIGKIQGESSRAFDRALKAKIDKQIERLTRKIVELDLSMVPDGILMIEMMKRENASYDGKEFHTKISAKDVIDGLGLEKVIGYLEVVLGMKVQTKEEAQELAEHQESAAGDICSFSDNELYAELRKRGWEGKMTKVCTLE